MIKSHSKETYILSYMLKSYALLCMFMILFFSACKTYIDINPSLPSITKKPTTIVLLLPFNKQWQTISESIQEGFMQANRLSNSPVKVHILNTKAFHSMYHAYMRSLQLQANLIIGPLLKEEVNALSQVPEMKLPVLTLNYLDQTQTFPAHFYQFGLSPLDEAKQLAQHAKINQHQLALVVVPNNTWGKEIAHTFTTAWQHLGGKITDTLYYRNSFQTLALQIRTFLMFKPPQQRRQDFDMIFLASTPAIGRQIKPLFDFYFAKNIPVYAISSIYDGTVPYHLNRDLNGIVLCDTTWAVHPIQQEKVLYRYLHSQHREKFQQYLKYYALGADAFMLTQTLALLDQDHHQTVNGVTGLLKLNSERQIMRAPPVVFLKQGLLKEISAIT